MAIIGSMNKGIFYFFVSHNNNLSSFHFPLSSFFLSFLSFFFFFFFFFMHIKDTMKLLL
jgi:hypothetical protein